MVILLAKNEAKNICKDFIRFGHFFNALAFSSVILYQFSNTNYQFPLLLVDFKSIKTGLIRKSFKGKSQQQQLFIFAMEIPDTSLKHKKIFGLNIFDGFVKLFGRIEPVFCLVFYLVIKMWQNLYKNHINHGKDL